MAKDKMECNCMHKGKGICALLLGIIVLVNAYNPFVSWTVLIGIVLVLMGIKKMMWCNCNK